MAKRPTINTLTNTASPTYLTQLNQNFTNIQAQFDNTLSLDGSLPNAMNADLDLNDNDLINAGTVNADNLVVAGTNLNSVVAQAATSATNAAASASSAAASAATASQYTPAYFTDVAALLADTRSWPTGQILNTREEGFAYEVVTSGQHVTTAGGVKLIVLPGDVGMNVKAFGAKGDGTTNDTAAIQLAATRISTTGGTILFPSGDYVISTRIDFTGNNVNCVLDQDAGIVYNTPDYVAFKFTGTNSSVVGGLGRGFIGPAAWDGANTPPTYGVIWFAGDGSYAKTRLFNVRKMGIWFKDVVDGTAEGCIIEGNYPSASWTGTEVGHVGVGFDTDVANAGNFKVLGCTIKSCVQGAFPANYGTGGVTQGFVATGNIFEGCWNHGIYSNFTNGAVITGNNFNRCQIPVVVSGNANTVSGNTMYTSVNTTGDERDVVGISVRDGSRNIVTGNTIKGVIAGGPTGVIVVQDVSGLSPLNDNIISNNTIEITAGSGAAIRVQGTTNGVNRNIIEGNNITCPGFGAARGAIELIAPSSSVNAGNKIVNNVVSLTALSEFVFATYQTASEVRGNTFELLWNAGSSTTVNAVWWGQGVQCNTQDNTLLCRTGYGANITFRGFRESLASSDNFITNIINAVGGSATYAFALTVAASGLTINQLGTGAPTTQAKIGSIWRRSDGGAGTTFYVKESGTDATGWVGK